MIRWLSALNGVKGIAVAGLFAVSLFARQASLERVMPKLSAPAPATNVVESIDAAFASCWSEKNVQPAPLVDDLQVARRASLALCGTAPSLEEIRWLEAQPETERLARWTERLLADPRCHFYLAERLARALNSSATAEPFFIYRRRRFVFWLAEQIAQRQPYDQTVRRCVAGEGVWIDQPETNFITGHDLDPVKLANRVTRGFLGLRLDCCQCHDHPFAPWKQSDFQGLAAWFGNARLGWNGVYDDVGRPLVENSATKKKEPVDPRVPFQAELMPAAGKPRERLAAWITHRENRYFGRAVANRMWALLLGKGLVEPIDNLEAPEAAPKVLDLLAEDFREHDCDLQRLIRVIIACKTFRLASAVQGETTSEQEQSFAAFPLTRLRADQVARSIVQTSKLFTIDDRTSTLLQVGAFGKSNDFIERFGDAGEEEMAQRDGNLAQRLLLLNGKVVHDEIKDDLMNSCRRLATLSPDESTAVRSAYLITVSRAPTPEESDYFVARLKGVDPKDRGKPLEDLIWALINSTEFAWNH